VLDGADCEGKYTIPLNCPRASYPYWREIWLERVPERPDSTSEMSAKMSSSEAREHDHSTSLVDCDKTLENIRR
jgi:hypothetical protein